MDKLAYALGFAGLATGGIFLFLEHTGMLERKWVLRIIGILSVILFIIGFGILFHQWYSLLGLAILAIIGILWVLSVVSKKKPEVNNVASIILELEATTVTLNGEEVSIARLFWGLSDLLISGLLGEANIQQLLSSRFREKDLYACLDVQKSFITELRAKILINPVQRQTTRHGSTETYFGLTDLGCEVLAQLKTKGWPEP